MYKVRILLIAMVDESDIKSKMLGTAWLMEQSLRLLACLIRTYYPGIDQAMKIGVHNGHTRAN